MSDEPDMVSVGEMFRGIDEAYSDDEFEDLSLTWDDLAPETINFQAHLRNWVAMVARVYAERGLTAEQVEVALQFYQRELVEDVGRVFDRKRMRVRPLPPTDGGPE